MTQRDPDSPVFMVGTIRGLPAGPHGFHVHEKGDLGNGCLNAGGHFNPFGRSHGARTDDERHVGDLGNIVTGDGEEFTLIDYEDSGISLYGERSILGRAIVVHQSEQRKAVHT